MNRFARLFASMSVVVAAGLHAACAVAAEPVVDLKARVAVEQGWLTAWPEGFAVRDAAALRDLRPGGAREQVVYVLSRDRRGFRVLTVTEPARQADPVAIERLIAALESARRWIETRPDDAAAVLARSEGVTLAAARERVAAGQYTTARPGPALAQFLKTGADAAQAAAVDALIDDSAMRAVAARGVRAEPLTALR